MVILLLFWLRTATARELYRKYGYILISWKATPPALVALPSPACLPFEETFFGQAA